MTERRELDRADQFAGAMLGLACGDAVGTTVEFRARGTFPRVTDMIGGGPFGLKPGQWTDDTSMALCLAQSLLDKDAFDARHQMGLYANWWKWGYLSSTGDCFDIGATTREALQRFLETGNPMSGSEDPSTAGNGSLMRLAPVVLFSYPDALATRLHAAESSRTTHAALEAVECCELFATLIGLVLDGVPVNRLIDNLDYSPSTSKVARIAEGKFIELAENDIRGSGYCIESLEAALWCFFHTDSFEAAVLRAVNLGDDADTTGAIVGQIAGAYYGAASIPESWLERVWMRELIESTAARFYARTSAPI